MDNMGRKVVKGRKTSAPMVMTSTSAAKTSGQPSTMAAAPASAVKAAATAMTAKAKPTLEEVARRSYEIFLARGGTDGRDVEDWVQAERDLGA